MNLLLLCTYPVQNASHGGQLRVKNIADEYRRAGLNVQVAGVLGSRAYHAEDGFVEYPGNHSFHAYLKNPFLMEDFGISKVFSEVGGIWYERLRKKIKAIPDIIHVEQPWLMPFAFLMANSLSRFPKLIYGSQNIEHRLKKEIVQSYFGSDAAAEAEKLILQCEINAMTNADGVVGVSQNDVDWIKANCNTPVCLAPNGVQAWSVSPEGRTEAAALTGGSKYALYCASAHPPNIQGFFEIFGGGFGSLNPRQRLVIAGGAGPAIMQDPRLSESAKLSERVIAPGLVPQSCLNGLLEEAQCIVLPLTQGEQISKLRRHFGLGNMC